jgi:hypothetical protein
VIKKHTVKLKQVTNREFLLSVEAAQRTEDEWFWIPCAEIAGFGSVIMVVHCLQNM